MPIWFGRRLKARARWGGLWRMRRRLGLFRGGGLGCGWFLFACLGLCSWAAWGVGGLPSAAYEGGPEPSLRTSPCSSSLAAPPPAFGFRRAPSTRPRSAGRRRPRLQFFYAWVVWLAGWLALWSIATLFWLLGGAEFCALTETVALSLCACIYSGFFLVSAVAQL